MYKSKYQRTSRPARRGQRIDPKRFIKAAIPVQESIYVPQNKFSDFNLNELLKQNLESNGFITPTPVQDKSISITLEGKDLIAVANTGTGKTMAFLLPLLNTIIDNRSKKALIVAPTRELALQIENECRKLAKGSGLMGVLLIGGVPIGPQLRDLRQKPEIIIGTPGRIKDHIERGSLKLDEIGVVVLDEVDRMLDMGFIHDVRSILSTVPVERQSLFFSATISPTIERLIKDFTESPVSIMAKTAETSTNVDQTVQYYVSSGEKMDRLHDILINAEVEKTLIFSETRRSVERLSTELTNRGFQADAMHGDKSQGQRQAALRKFRDSHVKILVATDVAARGIDVDGITHVINYDLPQTYDDYTHRIGRAGRAGNKGYAITFVSR
ncbi:MAG: DEAD/DEAH box helicase [Candidatus Saccharimonadales bacterium]